MRILVDTNILLRSVQPLHPMHLLAVHALETLLGRGEPLAVAIQNIAEFWNAATRPTAANGLGFTIEEAQQEIVRLERYFQILSENAASYVAWKTLVTAIRVSGVQVHDARLVAVMKTYAIRKILTFNVDDFARFSEVEPFILKRSSKRSRGRPRISYRVYFGQVGDQFVILGHHPPPKNAGGLQTTQEQEME